MTAQTPVLYYAVIAGSTAYDGLPSALIAVAKETDKAVTGEVLVQVFSYNNNLTRVGSTREYRASKRHILARFDDVAQATKVIATASDIAKTSVDDFGDDVAIDARKKQLAVLDHDARVLREGLNTLRQAAYQDRFQKILETLREGGASYVWSPQTAATE